MAPTAHSRGRRHAAGPAHPSRSTLRPPSPGTTGTARPSGNAMCNQAQELPNRFLSMHEVVRQPQVNVRQSSRCGTRLATLCCGAYSARLLERIWRSIRSALKKILLLVVTRFRDFLMTLSPRTGTPAHPARGIAPSSALRQKAQTAPPAGDALHHRSRARATAGRSRCLQRRDKVLHPAMAAAACVSCRWLLLSCSSSDSSTCQQCHGTRRTLLQQPEIFTSDAACELSLAALPAKASLLVCGVTVSTDTFCSRQSHRTCTVRTGMQCRWHNSTVD